MAWGERWQVKFAHEKTQAMMITRSQGEADHLRGRLRLGPDTIPLQDSIEILGVEMDSRLQFNCHLEKVARSASSKVNLLCQMKHLLHADSLLTLYKAQVSPIMEYASLTWMSSARCHLSLQDKVQRRVERLISSATHHQLHHPHWWRRQQHRQPQQEQQRHDLRDSLEHSRRVAALTVLHKAQLQRIPHLTDLGATWRRHEVGTRTMLANDFLEVPRSHSSTHQRALT
ncbi:hypothetical protein E2C01_087561 [Portunus trituberculatus]|uniref:RNA-directed DNA polymerase from mobile element jockey n=1 Tax=Portunus trituberculatus TaxID=210409 RepID=A0A5B7J6W6_PORTR|nr:hypothetical protein [Portunus trituberculatus]